MATSARGRFGNLCEGLRLAMMRSRRQPALRFVLSALAAALLAAGALAPSAGAAYGGLGRIGASTIKPGAGGGHGEVNPSGIVGHNFAVDPTTGDMYIAEQVENVSEARLQKFGSKGEFLAENKIKLSSTNGFALAGLAVDHASEKVYLLIADQRQAENEAKRTQLEKKEEAEFTKEEQLRAAEEKKEQEKVEKLKGEITKLQEEIAQLEEELPVYDEEVNAAGELWSFSTVVKEGALKEAKALVKKEALQPYSEERKGALLHPTGIAVDPTTHDVVISGQVDESPNKGFGEEELRAAVERVHEAGTLGPRYVDQGDCLDHGAHSAAEPACDGEGRAAQEFPQSPIVTPQGKVYVATDGTAGEVWEVPASAESTGGFKELASQPKRVFTLKTGQKLLAFVGGEEELPNTMAFASTGAGSGRIYVAAKVEGESGLLELEWAAEGEASKVTELGWTAGAPKTSKQEKCAIPPITTLAPLVGATGEQAMLLGTHPEAKEGGVTVEAPLAAVFGFGPGGEACGHPEATPPKVRYESQEEATTVPAGAATTVNAKVVGANAISTAWKLKYEGGEETGESGYQFEAPSLPHKFEHASKYEISEEVHTDNLGTPVVTKSATAPLTVTAGVLKAKITAPASVEEGAGVTLEATVTDPNEAEPHLKYVWDFGDGSAKVDEEASGKPSPVTLKVQHTFNTRCAIACKVTLKVKDGASEASAPPLEIEVTESRAEKEAHEPERREREAREAQERTEREAREAKERAEREAAEAAKHRAEEEAAAAAKAAEERKHGEERERAGGNPEVGVAGSRFSAASNGAVTIEVSCPAGEPACTGTLTLRTASAVSARAKKAVLTLATASVTVAGGHTKAVTLHLSSKGRKLLARIHTLKVLAVIVAHDSSGATRTTRRTIVLRLVAKRH